MQIKYDKGQMKDFRDSLGGAREQLMNAAKNVIQDSLLDIQTLSKSPGYVPYKTGNLKRSITHRLEASASQIIGYIGSNLVYAAIQEFGGRAGRGHTVNIRPKYYLTRSIKENLDKIKRRFLAIKIIKR